MPSFTTQVPNLQGVGPVVEVRLAVGSIIEEVLRKDHQNIPTPIPSLAMIDTGATGTVVREDIVSQLNLNPVGLTLINTPSSTNVQCYEYLMRILFPNNVIVETVVIAAPLKGQHIQCLIGRDVLRHGVLIYTGYIDTFTLSF
jgi:predicted aspartyl protease